MSTSTSLPSVLIVGGGIGGFILAVHLRKAGHAVRVIEQKAEYTQTNTGGGLSLTRNAFRYIFDVGLKDDFEAVADYGEIMSVMRASDGAMQNRLPGGQRYMVHRHDLLQLLMQAANKLGVVVSLGTSVKEMKEENDKVVATLSTGESVTADFLVGADGVHSKVRKHIQASESQPLIEPKLDGHCTFLIDMPKSVMDEDPLTRDLYANGQPFQFPMGELSTTVSWRMAHRGVYHLQINDHDYGTGARYGVDDSQQRQYVSYLEGENLEPFRRRFADYGAAFGVIFARTTRATKWLIAELPDLPSWSSASGRIILLGDAAHCFPPYAGQGSCMAIEDAAVLADLLGKPLTASWTPKTMADMFEGARKPRIERIRGIVKANVARWSGVKQEAVMTEQQLKETAAAMKWTQGYDAVEEARQYVQQGSSKLA